ncbi:MAG: flagellar basal body P-ring formation chaperone FlgA [Candidatus Zixiibacteriota bacterium]
MRKVSLITCTIGLLLSAILVAGDAIPEENQLLSYLTDEILTTYELDPELTEISIARTDIRATDFTDCEFQYYPLVSNAPRGRFPLRVEILKDGEMIDKGSVSLMVRRYDNVLVPVHQIRRHESLTPDMFAVKKIDVTSITETLVSDTEVLAGCRAAQNLMPDRAFGANRIEKIPDVENGRQITIIGNAGYLEIQVRGIALQQGYIGDNIKVKNIDSNKIVYGTVTAPGVVEVAI